MSFVSSVLLLIGLGCAIFVPVFFGHALSNEHGQRFYVYALIALVVSAAFVAAHIRSLRGTTARGGHHTH